MFLQELCTFGPSNSDTHYLCMVMQIETAFLPRGACLPHQRTRY